MSDKNEIRTEDIPVIPNPRGPSQDELRRLWKEATAGTESQPYQPGKSLGLVGDVPESIYAKS